MVNSRLATQTLLSNRLINIDSVSNSGQTPLHLAAELGLYVLNTMLENSSIDYFSQACPSSLRS